jgi:hypothetical protein
MVEWSRVGGIGACRRIEAPATSRHLRSSLRPLVSSSWSLFLDKCSFVVCNNYSSWRHSRLF